MGWKYFIWKKAKGSSDCFFPRHHFRCWPILSVARMHRSKCVSRRVFIIKKVTKKASSPILSKLSSATYFRFFSTTSSTLTYFELIVVHYRKLRLIVVIRVWCYNHCSSRDSKLEDTFLSRGRYTIRIL